MFFGTTAWLVCFPDVLYVPVTEPKCPILLPVASTLGSCNPYSTIGASACSCVQVRLLVASRTWRRHVQLCMRLWPCARGGYWAEAVLREAQGNQQSELLRSCLGQLQDMQAFVMARRPNPHDVEALQVRFTLHIFAGTQ